MPRPNGKGSVIVFTGIQPPGSLGVVQLISTDIGELFAEVGTETFSVLIGTEFEPDTHEPRKVQMLTPIYRHPED